MIVQIVSDYSQSRLFLTTYLCWVVEQPLVSRFVFIGSHSLLDLLADSTAHVALQGTKPTLSLTTEHENTTQLYAMDTIIKI